MPGRRKPSVYAVAARTTNDVVAAVNFARELDLRVVVKGGGHSYQGTSNAADSLLIWTRTMNRITVHDAFVGAELRVEVAHPEERWPCGIIAGHAASFRVFGSTASRRPSPT